MTGVERSSSPDGYRGVYRQHSTASSSWLTSTIKTLQTISSPTPRCWYFARKRSRSPVECTSWAMLADGTRSYGPQVSTFNVWNGCDVTTICSAHTLFALLVKRLLHPFDEVVRPLVVVTLKHARIRVPSHVADFVGPQIGLFEEAARGFVP